MTADSFLDGRVVLHAGDCREVLRGIPDASIDSIVTDPPYALVSIVKRFGSPSAKPTRAGDAYKRVASGFMGQQWDTGETAFSVEFWAECLRVLKPGGHVVAFSGTRTYHRMACAIEDAGFEIRDQLAWAYGSGFPKSHNVARHLGDEWQGWGTALKPAWEPICLARKPLIGTVAENVLEHGTGAINIAACRVGDEVRHAAFTSLAPCHGNSLGAAGTAEQRRGTQGEPKEYVGRWPANIVHDGSDEVVAAFPTVGDSHPPANEGSLRNNEVFGADVRPRSFHAGFADSGSAARFYYTAKADADDRIGSKHPTVKPVDLMQWLVRLVTPNGGVTLDPFAGTGTTGEAAWREGMSAVLIERDATFREDIARRMQYALAGPVERSHAITRARGKVEGAGPLFDVEAAE